jgi:hypothetical protein
LTEKGVVKKQIHATLKECDEKRGAKTHHARIQRQVSMLMKKASEQKQKVC